MLHKLARSMGLSRRDSKGLPASDHAIKCRESKTNEQLY
jgi:hypothetical protein